jgi:hypothetical protein
VRRNAKSGGRFNYLINKNQFACQNWFTRFPSKWGSNRPGTLQIVPTAHTHGWKEVKLKLTFFIRRILSKSASEIYHVDHLRSHGARSRKDTETIQHHGVHFVLADSYELHSPPWNIYFSREPPRANRQWSTGSGHGEQRSSAAACRYLLPCRHCGLGISLAHLVFQLCMANS